MVSSESIAEKIDCEDSGGLCAGGVVCGKVVVLNDPNVDHADLDDMGGLTSMVQCWNGQPLSLAKASDLQLQINQFLHPERDHSSREKIAFEGSQWKAGPQPIAGRPEHFQSGRPFHSGARDNYLFAHAWVRMLMS